jgi:hypothetical protein
MTWQKSWWEVKGVAVLNVHKDWHISLLVPSLPCLLVFPLLVRSFSFLLCWSYIYERSPPVKNPKNNLDTKKKKKKTKNQKKKKKQPRTQDCMNGLTHVLLQLFRTGISEEGI